jgi:hypothetical protein
MMCDDQRGLIQVGIWSLPLSPGQDSIEVTTSDPTLSYEAKVTYDNE